MNFILKLLKIQGLLFSPDDVAGIGDETPEETPEEDKDEETPEETDEEDKTDNDEGDNTDNSGGDDDEQEEDEEGDEEEPDETEKRLTSYTDVKKEFPDLFKKFPDLKAALFRDEKYNEIFGSVKDAQSAAERANTLTAIEHDLFEDGDPVKLLTMVKKNNPESYEKIITATFNELRANDKDLYLEVAAVPIKQVLRSAYREAQEKGDKNLLNSALWIHKFFFNDSKLEDKVKMEDGIKPKEKTKEQTEYEKRIKEIDEREYNGFKGAVDESYINQMSKEIRSGLGNDERISPFMQNVLVREILTEIYNQLQKDDSYQGKLNSLWKQAASAKFSSDFKSRIISTALARAKSLVPEVRKRLVKEALSGKQKQNTNKDNNTERRNNNPRTEPRREARNTSTPGKKLTDLDILKGRD